MADHLTEEEQIEAIKRWWSDNWLSVVLPIVLAALAYTGWNYWSDHKEASAAAASEQYEVLSELLQSAGSELSEEQRNEALTLADELRANYGDTLYADLSAMILAKLYVDVDKISDAEAALRAVVEDPANDSIGEIAKARLAKVLLEQGEHAEALTLVSKAGSEAMVALYAETRGDIYLDQGEIAAANTAYKEALQALSPSQFSHRGIVQFKVDGTKSAIPSPIAEDESAAEPSTEKPGAEEPQPELVVESANEESQNSSDDDDSEAQE